MTPETAPAGSRALPVLVVLAIVAVVLAAMTLGTAVIGLNAAAGCVPDAAADSCPATSLGPSANVGLQVMVLVLALTGVGRAQSGRDPSGVVLTIGIATVVISWGLVAVLTAVVVA